VNSPNVLWKADPVLALALQSKQLHAVHIFGRDESNASCGKLFRSESAHLRRTKDEYPGLSNHPHLLAGMAGFCRMAYAGRGNRCRVSSDRISHKS
jgi:hypothetical protein